MTHKCDSHVTTYMDIMLVYVSNHEHKNMAIPSDKRSVNLVANNDMAIVAVEPSAHKVGLDDSYDVDRPGSGCVSFHSVSYEVSSCFGRRRKVILDSVR